MYFNKLSLRRKLMYNIPKKIKLADLPTKIEYLEKSSKLLAKEIYIKRDDKIGVGYFKGVVFFNRLDEHFFDFAVVHQHGVAPRTITEAQTFLTYQHTWPTLHCVSDIVFGKEKYPDAHMKLI